MTLKGKKRSLTLLALLLWAGSGALAYWACLPPQSSLAAPLARAAKGQAAAVTNDPKTEVRLTAKDFVPYWTRPLRRPLYDPPPPPPKPVVKKPPRPIRAELLATMTEPGNSMALLKLKNGDVVFRKVGEAVGPDDADAKIAEIKPGSVLVRRGTKETRIVIEGAQTN